MAGQSAICPLPLRAPVHYGQGLCLWLGGAFPQAPYKEATNQSERACLDETRLFEKYVVGAIRHAAFLSFLGAGLSGRNAALRIQALNVMHSR